MKQRVEIDFWEHAPEVLRSLHSGGVLCTVADGSGGRNLLTLSWGLLGPFYHGHPVFVIAVTPQRYSFRFLESLAEFVIAVPDASRAEAVRLCGTLSGRDLDKFKAAGLTPADSAQVQAPSILECPVNIECRVYAKVAPPHQLLTPEHRLAPVERQHTLYFAEVLGAHGWEETNCPPT